MIASWIAHLVFRDTLSLEHPGFARIAHEKYPPGPDVSDAPIWQIFFYDSGGTTGDGKWLTMDNTHEVEQAYASWYKKKTTGARTQEYKFKNKEGREFSINFEDSKRVLALLRNRLARESVESYRTFHWFQSYVAVLRHEVDWHWDLEFLLWIHCAVFLNLKQNLPVQQ